VQGITGRPRPGGGPMAMFGMSRALRQPLVLFLDSVYSCPAVIGMGGLRDDIRAFEAKVEQLHAMSCSLGYWLVTFGLFATAVVRI